MAVFGTVQAIGDNNSDKTAFPSGVVGANFLLGNYAATTSPGVGNDNTQGYSIGSLWIDTTGHHVYMAAGVATGAAAWVTLG